MPQTPVPFGPWAGHSRTPFPDPQGTPDRQPGVGHSHLTNTGCLIHSIFQGQRGANRDCREVAEVQLASARSAGPSPHPQEGAGIFGCLAGQDRVADMTFMSECLGSLSDISQLQADVTSSLNLSVRLCLAPRSPNLACLATLRGKSSYRPAFLCLLASCGSRDRGHGSQEAHRDRVSTQLCPSVPSHLPFSCLLAPNLPQGLGSCWPTLVLSRAALGLLFFLSL